MCPMFNNGICQIAGIEPRCAGVCIWESCYKDDYENCKLYVVGCLIDCERSLKAA